MMEELIGSDSGTYRIRAATDSHFLLDLDGRTLTGLRAAVKQEILALSGHPKGASLTTQQRPSGADGRCCVTTSRGERAG